MVRRIVLAASALLFGSAAAAVPIVDVPVLPQADRAAINALEQAWFDSMGRSGIEATLVQTFKDMGQSELLTPQALTNPRQVDAKCGKIGTIERVNMVSFGTNVVRDYIVVRHANCMLLWELTYAKPGAAWGFRGYNFQTLDGNEWNY